MTQVDLYNMCLVHDVLNNRILVQDKVNSDWNGVTFPGGHVENAEGIVESTIREVKEETGLDVKNLEFCGLISWCNDKTHERMFVFLYKTTCFEGVLIDETHEGKVYWIDEDTIMDCDLAPRMEHYLELFNNPDVTEAFATWNEESMGDFKFY